MNEIQKYSFIIFEGPPAAGKTMIAKRLSKHFHRRLILEPTGSILPWFYQDMKNRALITQLYYLRKRVELAKKAENVLTLGEKICQDYAFWKDLVYAREFLKNKEFLVYKKLFDLLSDCSSQPDLLVLLDCKTEVIMSRLRHRRRKGEEMLKIADIENLRKRTLRIGQAQKCPKIFIDTSSLKIDLYTKARNHLFDIVVEKISSYK